MKKKALTMLALATLMVAGFGFAGCAGKKCCTDGSCAACIEKSDCADCKAAGALCPAHQPK